MLIAFKSFLKDYWISLPFYGVLVILTVSFWYTITRIKPSPEPLFLHYNVIFGVDLIGQWWKLWLIPVGGLLLYLFNFGISFFLSNSNRFVSRLLAVSTVILETLLVVGCVLIIGLNI